MIERFVELAPAELDAHIDAHGCLWLQKEHAYIKGYSFQHNASFTIALLEYLKGLANKYLEWNETEDPFDPALPKELIAPYNAYCALQRCWHTLTPEAVMQACIDVWEAME